LLAPLLLHPLFSMRAVLLPPLCRIPADLPPSNLDCFLFILPAPASLFHPSCPSGKQTLFFPSPDWARLIIPHSKLTHRDFALPGGQFEGLLWTLALHFLFFETIFLFSALQVWFAVFLWPSRDCFGPSFFLPFHNKSHISSIPLGSVQPIMFLFFFSAHFRVSWAVDVILVFRPCTRSASRRSRRHILNFSR